jgi:hypothetical protein
VTSTRSIAAVTVGEVPTPRRCRGIEELRLVDGDDLRPLLMRFFQAVAAATATASPPRRAPWLDDARGVVAVDARLRTPVMRWRAKSARLIATDQSVLPLNIEPVMTHGP